MSIDIDPILLPYKLGPQQVPGYWQFLLPEHVKSLRLPSERRATCAQCPMIAARGFRPDYRCCTYLPLVPGFAIGLALRQGQARPLLERLIKQGYMTPEGLLPSPLARFHFKRQETLGLYGKGDALCHLLDQTTGRCGIYAFRNGVCSTFFCIHDHGGVGEDFWMTLRDLVCQLETALQQWALGEMGFDVEHYMRALDLLAEDPLAASDVRTKAWRDDVLDILWGSWRGREAHFFLALADLVIEHKAEIAEISSKYQVVEPLRFEGAMARLISKDMTAPAPAPLATVPGSSPTRVQVSLLQDLEDALWRLPARDLPLTLHPAVTIDLKHGRLRFDEGDDYWELDLSAHETRALLYFASPHCLDEALAHSVDWKMLSDPFAFAAEYLACQVLYHYSE